MTHQKAPWAVACALGGALFCTASSSSPPPLPSPFAPVTAPVTSTSQGPSLEDILQAMASAIQGLANGVGGLVTGLTALSDGITAGFTAVGNLIVQGFQGVNDGLVGLSQAFTTQLTAHNDAMVQTVTAHDANITAGLTAHNDAVITGLTAIANLIQQIALDGLRRDIEANLALSGADPQVNRIVLFEMPTAAGGELETVRGVVLDSINIHTLAGVPVNPLALVELSEGDADLAASRFKEAYDHYRNAYQAAAFF
ncbi:MAG: hypothetical protein AAF628_13240 [Planctomycetota bacterium]